MTVSRPLTISVAMRVYNSSRFVGEQLASILTQSSPPEQIVIGDDGSDDNTLALITAMIETEQQARPSWKTEVTILSSGHVGITANIERTIAACTGDIVIICDHDDRCAPTRFEWIRAAFEQQPELLFIHSDATLIDEGGDPRGVLLTERQLVTGWERERYRGGAAFPVLIRRNIVTGATAAFRRELVSHAVPFPRAWVYDEWLGIVAAGMGRLSFLEEPLLQYRQHSSNKQGVRRRSAREKAGMLLAVGNGRNERLQARAAVLVERLSGLGALVPPQNLTLANAKLRHESARARLPRNRFLRALPVLRAAGSGAYARFARGRKDIVLDLIQPRD